MNGVPSAIVWATRPVQPPNSSPTDARIVKKRSSSNIDAAAFPDSQMEREFSSIWNYYLDAFDKDEPLSALRQKQGLDRLTELHANGGGWEPVTAMAAVIDMAKKLSKTKPYFKEWHCIMGKADTFASLLQQYEDTDRVPEAAELEGGANGNN